MPTIAELPVASIANLTDELPLEQSGTTRAVTVAQLLAGTQSALSAATGSLFGRTSLGAGPPEPVSLGAGLAMSGTTLAANGSDHAGYPVQGTLNTAAEAVINLGGEPMLMPLTELRELFSASGDVSINSSGTIGVSIAANALVSGALQSGGGTMTGPLVLAADPATPLQAATKEYVDAAAGLAIPLAQKGVASGVASLDTNGHVLGTQLSLANLDASAASAQITIGTVGRTLAARFGDELNIMDFGVLGNGTDETTTIQAAFTAASGRTLVLPPGTYIASTLNVPVGGLRLLGRGGIATLRQLSGVNEHFIVSSFATASLAAVGVTFDGNFQNNTNDSGHEFCTLRIYGCGASNGPPVIHYFDNCTFINGRVGDILVFGINDPTVTSYVVITRCYFLGGSESSQDGSYGPGYVNIQGPFITIVTDNVFDLGHAPAMGGRYGLGYQQWANGERSSTFSHSTISNNYFRWVGKCANGVQGAIDYYSGGQDVVISSNVLEQPYGRGITVKSDSAGVVIAANTIRGLNRTNATNYYIAQQIMMIDGPTETSGKDRVVCDNLCMDSSYGGICLTGHNQLDTSFYSNLRVSGNIVRGAVDRAISINQFKGVVVEGNTCVDSLIGLYVDSVQGSLLIQNNRMSNNSSGNILYNNVTGGASAILSVLDNTIDTGAYTGIDIFMGAELKLSGNHVSGTGGPPVRVQNITGRAMVTENLITGGLRIGNFGSNGALWVARNIQDSAYAIGDLTVENASGTVTAWAATQFIDTSTAAQSVSTIAGVPDGESIAIAASSTANALTLVGGGNIALAQNVISSGPTSVTVFRQLGGMLYPLNATNFPNGLLVGSNVAVAPVMTIDGVAGNTRLLSFQTEGTSRASIYLDARPETGADAGSSLYASVYHDNGTYNADGFSIARGTANFRVETSQSFQVGATMTLPVWATTARPATPVAGMVGYNSSLARFDFYTGAWQQFANIAGDSFTGAVSISTGGLSVAAGGVSVTTGGVTADAANVGRYNSTQDANLNLSAAVGHSRSLRFNTGVNLGWNLYADNAAQPGSNVGGDLHLASYNDAGVSNFTPLSVTRATGLVSVANGLSVTGNVGFFGASPTAKPTISGAKGGNAALGSLIAALAGLGLVTDTTSA